MTSYDHLIGEWIHGHGAARLHMRGKLLRVEEGPTATRLIMHPSYVVYDWDRARSKSPHVEVRNESTAEQPDVVLAEHFTRVGLQPKAWSTPEDEPAPTRARQLAVAVAKIEVRVPASVKDAAGRIADALGVELAAYVRTAVARAVAEDLARLAPILEAPPGPAHVPATGATVECDCGVDGLH